MKSHLEQDGLGKLELQGIGDPSGRGEGYSYVRTLRQAANLNNKKSQLSLLLDGDVKKLKKEETVKLLVSMGVRPVEAMAMRRWDRIRLIAEHTSKKLSARVNSLSAVKSANSFRETCQMIWDRQKAALKRTSIDDDKGNNHNNTSEVYHHNNTINTTVVTSSGGNAQEGKTQNNEEEDSDSDLSFDDIEKSLTARAAQNSMKENTSVMNEESESTRRRRVVMEQERKELLAIGSIFDSSDHPNKNNNNNNNATASTVKRKMTVSGAGPINTGTTTTGLGDPQTQKESSWMDGWVPPKKVVRRVTRRLKHDGTEMIKIEFIVSSDLSEVNRVEEDNLRSRKEREMKRLQVNSNEEVEIDDVSEDGNFASSSGKMTINLSKMKKVVGQKVDIKQSSREVEVDKDEDEYLQSRFHNSSGTGNPKTTSSKRTVTSDSVSSYRVPRVSFSARLDKEIMELWKTKSAHYFWFPVDPIAFPKYQQVVERPICLSDIRDNIANYKYETAVALIADVDLMLKNSEIFNGNVFSMILYYYFVYHYLLLGKDSPITTAAKNILSKLETNLSHERLHLGPAKDSIRLMEEAILKKKAISKKSFTLLSDLGNK